MAGIWEGSRSLDINPKAAGRLQQVFVEHIELQPIDPQTNGPQLLYGLRYHTHIVKPGEIETYHDQVGYWLWEPARGNLIQTVAIPLGQTVLAFGTALKDATGFELTATRDVTTNGICSNPFLEFPFETTEFRINVTIHADDSWEYQEHTVMMVRNQPSRFITLIAVCSRGSHSRHPNRSRGVDHRLVACCPARTHQATICAAPTCWRPSGQLHQENDAAIGIFDT
jgi:hypothetical protein